MKSGSGPLVSPKHIALLYAFRKYLTRACPATVFFSLLRYLLQGDGDNSDVIFWHRWRGRSWKWVNWLELNWIDLLRFFIFSSSFQQEKRRGQILMSRIPFISPQYNTIQYISHHQSHDDINDKYSKVHTLHNWYITYFIYSFLQKTVLTFTFFSALRLWESSWEIWESIGSFSSL